ncbi:metallophosphatase [Enterococcus saigonensis]|uniref:Metallophosphatase n=1 Tax=Enterococcus saigonensis TaxID=1805431 RepID=A0A679I942_9ENTE|nr:metallophosphoesterase [Enterococcus saigonensis]BCA84843.1 metallophosphatase [Enterococcus saigonensis]
MKFFTSDTHYFHQDLLGDNDFAPRPFKDIQTMHELMINNWNSVVKETDRVYHLGDIAMHPDYEAGYPEILTLLSRLNGQIIFIKGNHDHRTFFKFLEKNNATLPNGQLKFQFADVGIIIKFNHHQYYLTHYPLLLGVTKNIRNLHGHVHHYSVPIKENINVGVDAPEIDFLPEKLPFGTPLSENQIDFIAAKKAEELRSWENK